MQIADQKVVLIDYTLRDDKGTILDSSHGRQPLAYLHGAGNMIPGLEASLKGKSAGDTVHVTVQPADGYGELDQSQIIQVPRSRFEGVETLEVGMQFTASTPEGEQIVTIINIENDVVTVDGNHPLAGKVLNFELKVVDVRDATADELRHGHVHGAGGHQH